MKRLLVTVLCSAAALVAQAGDLSALPFNDDMVDVQKRTGVIMRGPAPGAVAVGFGEAGPATKADAEKLQNPVAADAFSIARGTRLYRVNCFPCHGDISKTPYQPGPAAVNSKVIPGVNIADKAYLDKTDGYIYGTIHFGGLAIMPALGWKLSPNEHWDIVNYVRKVQHDVNK